MAGTRLAGEAGINIATQPKFGRQPKVETWPIRPHWAPRPKTFGSAILVESQIRECLHFLGFQLDNAE
jgi:hypothetical protein